MQAPASTQDARAKSKHFSSSLSFTRTSFGLGFRLEKDSMSLQPALRACSFRKISSTADTDEVIAKNAHKNTIRKKLLKRQELKSKIKHATKNRCLNYYGIQRYRSNSVLRESLKVHSLIKVTTLIQLV